MRFRGEDEPSTLLELVRRIKPVSRSAGDGPAVNPDGRATRSALLDGLLMLVVAELAERLKIGAIPEAGFVAFVPDYVIDDHCAFGC